MVSLNFQLIWDNQDLFEIDIQISVKKSFFSIDILSNYCGKLFELVRYEV